MEGYFATLKRGVNGTYHRISEAHLHRYLAEFDSATTLARSATASAPYSRSKARKEGASSTTRLARTKRDPPKRVSPLRNCLTSSRSSFDLRLSVSSAFRRTANYIGRIGRLDNPPGRIRTCDLGPSKGALYPLSYRGSSKGYRPRGR